MGHPFSDVDGQRKAFAVEVQNWHEAPTTPPKHRLDSKLKSWNIDGTGAAAPTTQQVAGYDPNRYSLEIHIGDSTAFVVSQDNPSGAASVDAAATPPSGRAMHVPANTGGPPIVIYGPEPVWIVGIAGNAAMRVGVVTHNRVKDEC